ncbi:hypothetical protein [Actinomadura macrotermitis]|uniref:Uncharacterized protein n=1 Tax=Actinomadura macrotermitis TaxID=2585200 RepID=A0A7K0BYH3_9ACTN|nr:hypothetical protein [Actinomadura macrotermitis]MQY06238.1 hypothetical protein [Actinomadura macrotermitis]
MNHEHNALGGLIHDIFGLPSSKGQGSSALAAASVRHAAKAGGQ